MLLSWGLSAYLKNGSLCADLIPLSPPDCAGEFQNVLCPARHGDSITRFYVVPWYLAPCTVAPVPGHSIGVVNDD